MNLRVIKKLSKRAAPLLPLLGDDREQFRAEKDNNYHGLTIKSRKHWERSRCHPDYTAWEHGDEIVYTTRAGQRIVMRPPAHPLEGTIMVGCVSGYYEPEWDEECAYEALSQIVHWEFTDYNPETDDLASTRRIRTPRDVFAAARDMIAAAPNTSPANSIPIEGERE